MKIVFLAFVHNAAHMMPLYYSCFPTLPRYKIRGRKIVQHQYFSYNLTSEINCLHGKRKKKKNQYSKFRIFGLNTTFDTGNYFSHEANKLCSKLFNMDSHTLGCSESNYVFHIRQPTKVEWQEIVAGISLSSFLSDSLLFIVHFRASL